MRLGEVQIANRQVPSAFVNELSAPESKILVHLERFQNESTRN